MSDLAVKGTARLYRPKPTEIEVLELDEEAKFDSPIGAKIIGRKGDFLLTYPTGEQYVVNAKTLAEKYEPADQTCFVDLCFDFDGVIHSYLSGWQGIDVIPDKPVANAIYKLYGYMNEINNYSIAIFSARSASMRGIEAMKNWLQIHDTEFRHNYTNGLSEFNRSRTPTQIANFADSLRAGNLVDRIEFPTTKPAAKVYIDDRGFRFNGNFPYPGELEDAMVVWYANDRG